MTAVDLGNPAGDMVEEVTIVGHRNDRARVGREVLFEPEHTLGVEVVGGLVEQEQVGGLNKELAQRHTATFTTGEHGDRLVRGGAAQRIHGLVELRIDIPRVGSIDLGLQLAHFLHERIEVRVGIRHLFGNLIEARKLAEDVGGAHTNVLDDGLRVVEDGLLHQNADRVAGGQTGLTIAGLVQTSHDLQDRGLTSTIGADHTDLGAREKAHGDIVEDDLVTDGLASLDHLINKLRHVTPFGWFGRAYARVFTPMVPTRYGPMSRPAGCRGR